MATSDPADDPTADGSDRYRPVDNEPYTVGDRMLLGLAMPGFLFCISCLSQTPFWMSRRSSRRRLLLSLIGTELLGAAIIVAVVLILR